ncbi:MAG TPA: ABC transporter permease [Blastocatellia bacterium]
MTIDLKNQVDILWNDLRFALRALLRAPLITAITLASLSLAIGANTAVLRLIDTVMLRMLPVKEPQQLYFLMDTPKDASAAASLRLGATPFFSYDELRLMREESQSLAGFASFSSPMSVSVFLHGHADLAVAQAVSGNYFSMLGITAAKGRTFDDSEDSAAGSNPVAVVSHQYWQDQLGGDPSISGQDIRINETPFTIIGVAPAGFFGLEPGVAPEIWVPASMRGQVVPPRQRDRAEIVARLRAGIGPDQARAELAVIFDRVLERRLAAGKASAFNTDERAEVLDRKIEMTPGGKGLLGLRDRMGDPLLAAFVIAVLILHIACANVATLVLVKAGRRAKEFAIRFSLGATRPRLVRQLVTEHLLLAVVAAALGIVCQYWAIRVSSQMLASGPSPVKLPVDFDPRGLSYAAALTIIAVLLFGLLPALKATGLDVAPALRENSNASGGRAVRITGGRLLVAIQVALSVVLLIAAGLFIRTLTNFRKVDLGLKGDKVLLATANPSLVGYKGRRATEFSRTVLERLERLPGVRSCSVSSFPPLGQMTGICMIDVPGHAATTDDDRIVDFNWVGPRYFETLGIAVLAGRSFGTMDDQTAAKVAVVNQSLANKYFGGQDPVGKTIEVRLVDGNQQVEICGVAKDSKYGKLTEDDTPTVYGAFLQNSGAGKMTIEVLAQSDPAKLAAPLRGAVADIGPDVPVFDVETIEHEIDESLVQERLISDLSALFGLLALFLACIGLFGTTAYEVARRTNEIGIRMALGAEPSRVLRSVMGPALGVVLAGVGIGLSVAAFTAPLASKLLFRLNPKDPLTFTVAACALLLVTSLAAYIPARRASRISPTDAIRY